MSNNGEDGKSSETGGFDALSEGIGFEPQYVSGRIFGSNACRGSRLQSDSSFTERPSLRKSEREAITGALESATLQKLSPLSSPQAQGTEHKVQSRGAFVEKQQSSDGWIPILNHDGKFSIVPSRPSEYLRRLHLQNELFGDVIRVIGVTIAGRFAIVQPNLRGQEPSEIEIREVLEGAGWQRIPMELQDLPPALMGSAWWHGEEDTLLIDARKPNFKKTPQATLPIDLILSDLTPEMRERLNRSAR